MVSTGRHQPAFSATPGSGNLDTGTKVGVRIADAYEGSVHLVVDKDIPPGQFHSVTVLNRIGPPADPTTLAASVDLADGIAISEAPGLTASATDSADYAVSRGLLPHEHLTEAAQTSRGELPEHRAQLQLIVRVPPRSVVDLDVPHGMTCFAGNRIHRVQGGKNGQIVMGRAADGRDLEFSPAVAIQRSIDHAEYLEPPTPRPGDTHTVRLAERSPAREHGDDGLTPARLREANAIPWPTLILPEAAGGALVVSDTSALAPVVTFKVTGETPTGETLAHRVTVVWVPETLPPDTDPPRGDELTAARRVPVIQFSGLGQVTEPADAPRIGVVVGKRSGYPLAIQGLPESAEPRFDERASTWHLDARSHQPHLIVRNPLGPRRLRPVRPTLAPAAPVPPDVTRAAPTPPAPAAPGGDKRTGRHRRRQ